MFRVAQAPVFLEPFTKILNPKPYMGVSENQGYRISGSL